MKSQPYIRAFTISGGFFLLFLGYSVFKLDGYWEINPLTKFALLITLCLVIGLVTGFVASRRPTLSSWRSLAGVAFVSLFGLVMAGKALVSRLDPTPKFASTDEMMVYLAKEAARWVKQDTGTNLDYSIESVRLIEDRLGHLSGQINRTNPPQGTFGIALGYGAYVGEVLRKKGSGAWATDHPAGGRRSFPLTLTSNRVVFPVSWCYKRIINGEEDNVYLKLLLVEQAPELDALTNSSLRLSLPVNQEAR